MKHKRILAVFLMTYVPLVLAAFIAVLTLLLFFSKGLQEEINRQHFAGAARVQHGLDAALTSISQEAHSLVWDPTVSSVSLEAQPLPNHAIYNSYLLSKTLRSKRTLSLYTYESLLYFSSSDTVVTSTGMLRAESHYRNYALKYNLTFEEWMALISTPSPLDAPYTLLQTQAKDDETKSYLFCVKAISKNSQSEAVSSSVIIVDLDLLLTAVLRESFPASEGCFLYQGDKLVLSHDTQFQAPFFARTDTRETFLAPDAGVVHTKIGNSVIASIPSKALPSWRIITENPTSVVYEDIHKIYPPVVLALLFILLLGAVLSWILIVKSYRPLRRMQSLISESVKAEPAGYEAMEHALLEMIDSKQKTADNVARQAAVIRRNLLTDLLFGTQRDVNETRTALRELQMPLYTGRIMVFALFGDYRQEVLSAWDEVRATFQPYFSAVYIVPVEPVFYLMAAVTDVVDDKALTGVLRAQLQAFCTQFPGLRCGASSIRSHFTEFNHAYNELVVVLETASETPQSDVLLYSEVQQKLRAIFEKSASPQTAHAFTDLIGAQRFEEAKAFLLNLLTSSHERGATSLFAMKSTFFTLLSGAVNHLSRTCPDVTRLLLDESDIFERIANAHSMEILRQNSMEAIDLISNAVQAAAVQAPTHSKSSALVRRISAYIHENYLNPNLNVSVIAQQFHLNLSYLSKVFKEATGQNVLECINLLRVEKAKQLLKSTDSSIRIIAEQSGFFDSSALIRCLKKYEGTTPSKYREFHL